MLLEFAQALFPRGFQSASDKPVLRIHGTIATLGALRFVAGSFHGETPLHQRRIVVRFDLLGGLQCRFKGRWLEGFKNGLGDGLIDLHSADVQAINTAAVDDVLARAVVTGASVSSRVLGA